MGVQQAELDARVEAAGVLRAGRVGNAAVNLGAFHRLPLLEEIMQIGVRAVAVEVDDVVRLAVRVGGAELARQRFIRGRAQHVQAHVPRRFCLPQESYRHGTVRHVCRAARPTRDQEDAHLLVGAEKHPRRPVGLGGCPGRADE